MDSEAVFTMQGLVPGRIVSRYKRFLADVELEDGRIVTAHCTNTGTMKTCWEPGDPVLLAPADSPSRKLKYTWIACRRGEAWIGVETGLPNRIVARAARLDRLPGLPGLRDVRTEVPYGSESSRIDVLARDADGCPVYIEVKNTTLRIGDWACFPDAVTERGVKHLRELRGMVRAGHRAALVCFIHRSDVCAFDAAREIDVRYASELEVSAAEGVVILPVLAAIQAIREMNGTWGLAWHLDGLLPWQKRA
ncbi:MAG TPA: DNA/RNA nuclease SfsA [Holophaga sp.]|nr:DNA/RNA nuclease SfsA [Holophaga sp.]